MFSMRKKFNEHRVVVNTCFNSHWKNASQMLIYLDWPRSPIAMITVVTIINYLSDTWMLNFMVQLVCIAWSTIFSLSLFIMGKLLEESYWGEIWKCFIVVWRGFIFIWFLISLRLVYLRWFYFSWWLS